jgi:hypothetical protein
MNTHALHIPHITSATTIRSLAQHHTSTLRVMPMASDIEIFLTWVASCEGTPHTIPRLFWYSRQFSPRAWNSMPSEVNVKNTFTSQIDNKIFLTFLLTSLSMLLYRKKVKKKIQCTHNFKYISCLPSKRSLQHLQLVVLLEMHCLSRIYYWLYHGVYQWLY